MNTFLRTALIGTLFTMSVATAAAGTFEITPVKQAEIDRQSALVAKWAADPVVVNAVREQNKKGPMADMDNTKWRSLRASDDVVKAFQTSPAGSWLKSKMDESSGLISEAFLNAAQGEKVAFVEKTSSYNHKGTAKFDQPMAGQTWQGKPEFDESSQTFAIQISVPVVDAGAPIGAMVVGINLTRLEKLSKNKK